MRSRFVTALLALALFAIPFLAACTASHTETDHPNLFGGSTHTDTTVIQKN